MIPGIGGRYSDIKVLLVDNWDSFTYNLMQYFQEIGASVVVKRPEQLEAQCLEKGGERNLQMDALVISPGPKGPDSAAFSVNLIRQFPELPLLGVCLGHQCMAVAYGGQVGPAREIVHGKISVIRNHCSRGVFSGLPMPMKVARYHSLAVVNMPSCFNVDAISEDGEIMAMSHRNRLHFGIQFHPESFMSEYGRQMLRNFLELALQKKQQQKQQKHRRA